MKRPIAPGAAVFSIFLLFSCSTAPEITDTEQPPPAKEADGRQTEDGAARTLAIWQQAIKTENIDLFMDQYWPDARLDIINGDGSSDYFVSKAAIRSHQMEIFRQIDFNESTTLPRPELVEEPRPEQKNFRIRYQEARMMEWFVLLKRDEVWKIQRQEMILQTPGPWVISGFQAWADNNRDGFLEPEENHRLADALVSLSDGPHRAVTPTDSFFDTNRDGSIDAVEVDRIREILFRRGFLQILKYHTEWAAESIDLDGDGQASEGEVDQIIEFLFGNPALREPHNAQTPLDRRMDNDGNGQVSGVEIIEEFMRRMHEIGGFGFADETILPVPRPVTLYMDGLADVNNSGTLEKNESDFLIQTMGGEHHAVTYLDWKIDTNKNGFVDGYEINRVRQASAAGKKYRSDTAVPPFAAVTAADVVMDGNGNGSVEQGEIDFMASLFAGQAERGSVPEKVRNLFDSNRDGGITGGELEQARTFFIFPHPVRPGSDFDGKLDKNGDGFIIAEELGIPAGVTSGGAYPTMNELIELARWRTKETRVAAQAGTEAAPGAAEKTGLLTEKPAYQSEYYMKLGQIQDRKLAVVGLNARLQTIDEDTALGLVVFIENAFVNVGKVRVVDRRNIEKIVEEYRFQTGAYTDEATAVEIGKLAGADIIVIGSLNFVGKKYYLNIKLITVQTGEIIGSSIAEALDDTAFLKMCNDAVYTLF
ncbi:MAG: hypothetical protein E4H36_09295 [Spirochaetales bacterium]|nr:MAG: hypothetical protein E4H36_09295 [Spirochaetales bacterium]